MISTDEDALVCDFAETYHIYDYKALPVSYAAALACGLGPDSRIKMAISGAKVPTDVALQAAIIDRLSLLLWMQTEDGAKGRNRPKSLLDELTSEKPENPVSAFASGDEFMRMWAMLAGKEDVDGN